MNCLFCKSTNVSKASYPRSTKFNGKLFDYYKCNDCDLVFVNPLPNEDDYKEMYAKSYHNDFYFKDLEPEYSNWSKLFEKFNKESSILDYGCGDGSFLKYFRKKGFECTGVEFDADHVKRLKEKNPDINFFTIKEFWDLDPSKQFSAIFLGDVLEHLTEPREFLIKILGKLKKGGIIAVQGPIENNANLALETRKALSSLKNSTANHTPYHIFFSNAKNQKDIFEIAGFKSLHYQIHETPWPYPSDFNFSLGNGLKFLIGQASIACSKTLPGNMGNRFVYVGEKI